MPKDPRIKKVLVIGSGPIIIGQAAEFDYSGTQACRALKAEGIETVLLNSNPATIMTDPDVADHVYIEPMTLEVVERMLAAGLLDEVRALDVPGPDGLRQGPTSSRAIGYAQMLAVLDGTLTPEQAAEQTVVATRRFARRQETWFRADPRVHWVDALAEDVVEQALAVL